MKRNGVVWFIGALVLGATLPSGFALEPRVKPPALTSTPTPPITSTDGSVSALDLTGQTPRLTLTGTGGRSWTFHLDRSTTVWKGGQSLALNQLKVGERVRVRHRSKGGKKVVKSIEIL